MTDPANPKENGELQPILAPEQDETVNEWQTGLFDCWDDCHLTAVGLCCPQCLHADNATRMDSFATCCPYQCSYICLTSLLLCSRAACRGSAACGARGSAGSMPGCWGDGGPG